MRVTLMLALLFFIGCAENKDITTSSEYRKLSDKYQRMKMNQAASDKQIENTKLALTGRFKSDVDAGNIDLRIVNGVLIIYAQETFAFKVNSAELNDAFKAKLVALAEVFAKTPDKMIRVEGHTAVEGLSKGDLRKYPSSWELGAARAISVVRYLQNKCNVRPENMVVVTFGAFRPLASNVAESGRVRNRRVEISLVDSNLYSPGVNPHRIDESFLMSEETR